MYLSSVLQTYKLSWRSRYALTSKCVGIVYALVSQHIGKVGAQEKFNRHPMRHDDNVGLRRPHQPGQESIQTNANIVPGLSRGGTPLYVVFRHVFVVELNRGPMPLQDRLFAPSIRIVLSKGFSNIFFADNNGKGSASNFIITGSRISWRRRRGRCGQVLVSW